MNKEVSNRYHFIFQLVHMANDFFQCCYIFIYCSRFSDLLVCITLNAKHQVTIVCSICVNCFKRESQSEIELIFLGILILILHC